MAEKPPNRPFDRFVEVIRLLRDPVCGCPWDLKQDHKSLRPYLIEEAYEVLEAIEAENDRELAEELGDLLLQAVLHAQIASDRGAFTIDDVVVTVTEKMIRRHPHVFGEVKVEDADEVVRNWEQIKQQEKGEVQAEKRTVSDALAAIPKAIPALIRAQRLGEKAAKVSFDWKSAAGVWEKVQEELTELGDELKGPPENIERKGRVEHELGDLLFSLCQFARWEGLDAENALRGAADRFLSRFSIMEESLKQPMSELTEDELEEAWQRAKAVANDR